ncbi:hypothetical protein [Streptomyces sp. NPDC085665]|uniref:hypothetical protein n=1 Tax=Streptomyces sp. NPDC085665 TaxID=3365735 RepID=UPI0037D48EF9
MAARGTDRQDYGGPAIIPTVWQLVRLAQDGKAAAVGGRETTTYPEAMAGIGIGWESKAAAARRRRERDASVAVEVLRLPCEKCGASDGQQCTTAKGWPADKAQGSTFRWVYDGTHIYGADSKTVPSERTYWTDEGGSLVGKDKGGPGQAWTLAPWKPSP